MAGNNTVLNRLEQRASEADQVIEYLKQQVALLKEKASQREEKKLRVENAKLKKEIDGLKEQLMRTEIQNGVKQVPLPTNGSISLSRTEAAPKQLKRPQPIVPSVPAANEHKGETEEKKKKTDKKGEKKEKKQTNAADEDSKPVDVSRLDLRVGCIVTAKKHPDADSLYVEEVDIGEAAPRTVVSGLVKHVPLEQIYCKQRMQDDANGKWVSKEKVSHLEPYGHEVQNENPQTLYCPSEPTLAEGEPEKELNPKKKIWEQVQPDLRTDEHCVATYKGVPFEVKGKGVCKAQTMSKSGIK